MNALLPATLALGNKIETFGAYFGYAAVIGLGVLSMLYFSQAKEVKRLRDWAGRSPERDADLAQRGLSEVHRRVVGQPIVPQAAAVTPGGPQTPAAQQAEAARKAAAATVMQKFQPPGATPGAPVPVVAPPGQLARPAGPGAPAATPATAGPGTAASPSPAGTPAPVGTPSPATGPAPGPAVPPSPATAGAVAAARQAAIAGRSPAAASNGDVHDPLNPPISRVPIDLPPRQPREVTLTSGRSGSRVGIIVGGIFTVLVIAVAIVLLLSAGGDSPSTPSGQSANTPPPASASKPPPPAATATKVNRRATKVAVLNGTFQNGLAASVASKIEDKGFTILSKGTNADQQVPTTTVSYASGHKPAALLVAQIVGVSAGAVKASDVNTATAAGPDANVVVIIGADVASTG